MFGGQDERAIFDVPGDACQRCDLAGFRDIRNHARGDGCVCGWIDENETAGDAVIGIAIETEHSRRFDGHLADAVHL